MVENTFVQQGCIKLIKTDSKCIYDVKNSAILEFIYNNVKCINFNKKYSSDSAQSFSTLIIIINVSWSVNQYISMISERSCDTEDWLKIQLWSQEYITFNIHIETFF